jgi:hypothetical protein
MLVKDTTESGQVTDVVMMLHRLVRSDQPAALIATHAKTPNTG